MKIFCIAVVYRNISKHTILNSAFDLSSFGFFQRSSVQEFMNLTVGILVERAEKGARFSVKEKSYTCHCYVRADNLSAVAICDEEYPPKAAFSFLVKILSEYAEKYAAHTWPDATFNSLAFDLTPKLTLYQDPKEADTLIKIQSELDETKEIVRNTVEQVLVRGEKLEDLISKSEELSAQSKLFYKTAKKTNSCC